MKKSPSPTRRIFGLLMAFLLVASLLPLIAVTSGPVQASPDPNFGYENKGSSNYASLDHSFDASKFTCPESGTAQSITMYLGFYEVSTNIKFAIYDDDSGYPDSLVGYTEEFTITSGWDGWKTLDIVWGGSLSNADYWLVHWANARFYYYYDAGGTRYYKTLTYGDFPETYPAGASSSTRKLSIYCTYTAAGANPPEKPVLVSPENNHSTSDNTPTFTWTAGSGATSHRLVIDNDSTFSDGDNIYDNTNLGATATTCTIENELPPDNYWWKICATNAEGDNWSENTWTFEITAIANTAPNTPTNLLPTGVQTTTSITISCVGTDNDGDDMNVHFYDNSDNSPIDNIWIENGQTAQVTWDGLTHGQMYVFFAGAQDIYGAWGENSDTQSFWVILHGPELAKPVENRPYFEWSDLYADNYRLLVDNNRNFLSPTENRVLGENHYWIPSENSLENGVWYWKVIAYFDGEEVESDVWSFSVGGVGEVGVDENLYVAMSIAVLAAGVGVIIWAFWITRKKESERRAKKKSPLTVSSIAVVQ